MAEMFISKKRICAHMTTAHAALRAAGANHAEAMWAALALADHYARLIKNPKVEHGVVLEDAIARVRALGIKANLGH